MSKKTAKQTSNKNNNIKKKEQTKNNTPKITSTSGSNEISNLIKIVVAVLAIFMIFYFITTLITGENKKETEEPEEITINYDEILIGNLLLQQNKEYYVLITTQDDNYVDAYKTHLSSYKSKKDSLRVYTADLDSGFNRKYYDETSNIVAANMEETKFSGTTLLKVKDKKIVSTYETSESILAQLKQMNK